MGFPGTWIKVAGCKPQYGCWEPSRPLFSLLVSVLTASRYSVASWSHDVFVGVYCSFRLLFGCCEAVWESMSFVYMGVHMFYLWVYVQCGIGVPMWDLHGSPHTTLQVMTSMYCACMEARLAWVGLLKLCLCARSWAVLSMLSATGKGFFLWQHDYQHSGVLLFWLFGRYQEAVPLRMVE